MIKGIIERNSPPGHEVYWLRQSVPSAAGAVRGGGGAAAHVKVLRALIERGRMKAEPSCGSGPARTPRGLGPEAAHRRFPSAATTADHLDPSTVSTSLRRRRLGRRAPRTGDFMHGSGRWAEPPKHTAPDITGGEQLRRMLSHGQFATARAIRDVTTITTKLVQLTTVLFKKRQLFRQAWSERVEFRFRERA